MVLSSDGLPAELTPNSAHEAASQDALGMEGVLRVLEGLSVQLDQLSEASLGLDHSARFAQLFSALSAIEERMNRLEILRRETPPQASETLHRLSGEVARLRIALQDEHRRAEARIRRERFWGLGLLVALGIALAGLWLAV